MISRVRKVFKNDNCRPSRFSFVAIKTTNESIIKALLSYVEDFHNLLHDFSARLLSGKANTNTERPTNERPTTWKRSVYHLHTFYFMRILFTKISNFLFSQIK